MQISQKAQACHLSPIRKFYPFAMDAELSGKKIYSLNIGQPDIETPKVFYEAVRDYSNSVLAYAQSPGVPSLIKAIRRYYRRLGVNYANDDILITTGGSEALLITMLCILDEGSEVIVPEPFYPNYTTFIQAAGGKIRPLPTCPEEGYNYANRERLESLINEKTRAILITNPNNPTGNSLSEKQLRLVTKVARDHGLYMICDEVYREFVYDHDNIFCAGKYRDIDQNIVIIDSVSKRFSGCGARVGMMISRNKELMAQALKFCQGRLCVATLDQIGATALYDLPPEYFKKIKEEYKRRRDVCYEKLSKIPGVVCTEPKGAFYMMAKLPIDDAELFQTWLLTDFEDRGESVMFSPGKDFYATPGKGINEIRIAYVLEEEKLSRALDLLALAIEEYNHR